MKLAYNSNKQNFLTKKLNIQFPNFVLNIDNKYYNYHPISYSKHTNHDNLNLHI